MAYSEVNSPLMQKVGQDIVKINVETIASQVLLFAEDGVTKTNMEVEVGKVRTRLGALEALAAGKGTTNVVADIAARDALENPIVGDSAWVKDATADTSVKAGAAFYIYDGSAWEKFAEAESMDLVIKWEDISDLPDEMTIANIVDAIAKKHEHSNKTDVLDKLSTEDDKLLFDGNPISSSPNILVNKNPADEDFVTTLEGMDIPDGSFITAWTTV